MIIPHQIRILWLVFCVKLINCRRHDHYDSDIDDEYFVKKPHKSWTVKFPSNDFDYGKKDDSYDHMYHPKPYTLVRPSKYDQSYTPYSFNSNDHEDDEYHDHPHSSPNYHHHTTTTDSYLNLYQSNNDKKYDQINDYMMNGLYATTSYPVLRPNKHTVKFNCYDREHTCVSLGQCPLTRFDDIDKIERCNLSHKMTYGICCPPAENPTQRQPIIDLPISRKATKNIYPKKLRYFPNVNRNLYRSFDDDYDYRLNSVKQIESALIARKLIPKKYSPELAHHNFFGNHKEALYLGLRGEKSIKKALEIAKNQFHNHNQLEPDELTASTNIETTINATECLRDPICSPSKYRSIDGSCNNHLHPNWGKSFQPYNRVLNPVYGDGINSPRLSKTKQELPNVRKLSVELTKLTEPPNSKLTLAAMQFGQFIDHDFASAAPTRTESGSAISCCNAEILANPNKLKHPACFEIQIDKEDPFFNQHNLTCMNFVRSIATPRSDCKLAPREQLNQPTSFIDGSHIYGSTIEAMKSLRAFEGGRLLSKLSVIRKVELLPSQNNGTCNIPGGRIDMCYRAGDPRVNENIDLAIMQTIFLREHNRIARELQRMNPGWSDEKLFFETRAIIGAQIQHIVYSEFLPGILDHQTLVQFGLLPNEHGPHNKYDPKINPTVLNEFGAAAYRLHSSIQGKLEIRDHNNELIGEVPLSATFNNPTLLIKPLMFDGLIYGMTRQSMQKINRFFTTEVTNKLFKPWNSSFGLDLLALNIQRGRDHGLKGYPSWLKQCGLNKVTKWKDLLGLMPESLVHILRNNYETFHDIDLYVAGILEDNLPNSELGPLFSCLVAEQFRRLKYGDRFFYENGGQINSFTKDQLAEIKKVSIARLFCDNGDHIVNMQPHAFIVPSYWWNKRVSCDSELIPKMSLEAWSH